MTIVRDGFRQARNFARSRFEEAIGRAERSNTARDGHARRAELESEVELDSVSLSLRQQIPRVLRYGVGDEPSRAIIVNELTQDERVQAVRDLEKSGSEVQAWLDSFGGDSLPPEAAAFMHAILAVEQMKT